MLGLQGSAAPALPFNTTRANIAKLPYASLKTLRSCLNAGMHLQDNELQGTLVTRLQRKVDGMQRIALKVQNVLDDVASVLERCQGLICWADPNASAFFLLMGTAFALGVAVLGLHTILSFLLCWMVSPPLNKCTVWSPQLLELSSVKQSLSLLQEHPLFATSPIFSACLYLQTARVRRQIQIHVKGGDWGRAIVDCPTLTKDVLCSCGPRSCACQSLRHLSASSAACPPRLTRSPKHYLRTKLPRISSPAGRHFRLQSTACAARHEHSWLSSI